MTADKNFGLLFKMHQGAFYTRLLHEGIRLAVFDHLTQRMEPGPLAEKLAIHPRNTLFFLRGLVAIGLADTDKTGGFRNTPLSQKYLVQGSPSYLGEYLANHARWNQPFFQNMESILQSGPPEQELQADDEGIWAKEALGLINFQRTCTGPALAQIISSHPGFLDFSKMLDLGGGPGLNAIAVVGAHPSMSGTIFDRPAVTRVAREEIKKAGMEERIAVQKGDFTHDSLGKGYDLIMATACLNFVREDLGAMMKKIFTALNPGGVFISVHDGMTQNRTRPESIALSWLPVSMMWQELGLDRGDIAQACITAGFKTIQSRPLVYGLGTMELDMAQKP